MDPGTRLRDRTPYPRKDLDEPEVLSSPRNTALGLAPGEVSISSRECPNSSDIVRTASASWITRPPSLKALADA